MQSAHLDEADWEVELNGASTFVPLNCTAQTSFVHAGASAIPASTAQAQDLRTSACHIPLLPHQPPPSAVPQPHNTPSQELGIVPLTSAAGDIQRANNLAVASLPTTSLVTYSIDGGGTEGDGDLQSRYEKLERLLAEAEARNQMLEQALSNYGGQARAAGTESGAPTGAPREQLGAEAFPKQEIPSGQRPDAMSSGNACLDERQAAEKVVSLEQALLDRLEEQEHSRQEYDLLSRQVADKELELQAAKKGLRARTEDLQERDREVTQERQKAIDAEERLQDVQRQLDAERKDRAALSQRNAALERDVLELQAQLRQVHREFERLETVSDRQRNEKADLEKKLEHMEQSFLAIQRAQSRQASRTRRWASTEAHWLNGGTVLSPDSRNDYDIVTGHCRSSQGRLASAGCCNAYSVSATVDRGPGDNLSLIEASSATCTDVLNSTDLPGLPPHIASLAEAIDPSLRAEDDEAREHVVAGKGDREPSPAGELNNTGHHGGDQGENASYTQQSMALNGVNGHGAGLDLDTSEMGPSIPPYATAGSLEVFLTRSVELERRLTSLSMEAKQLEDERMKLSERKPDTLRSRARSKEIEERMDTIKVDMSDVRKSLKQIDAYLTN
eukprot:scaffold668_cov385-Prasinococcus_capsulatus_cf.AAC.8